MLDMKAETCVETFLQGWIARFGVPDIITTDGGLQFESELFQAFTQFLGSQRIRPTSYHPASNGMVERFHRQLKDVARGYCLSTSRWTSETLRLPGEFFSSYKASPTIPEFIHRLKTKIQSLQPVPASNHAKHKVFLHKDLAVTTHVFVRRDSIRRPLEQPYDGPYKVLSRTDKIFTLDMHGQKRTVTVDRLKPAYILNEHLDPADVLPHAHSEYKTKYGRVVRFRITPPVE
ncbi:Gag-Pol polyprotein like [Argiope bruennichi]|uniref:Gag-Pol polyprotein like n=1 Tax=Argiope bruennichi TaxID=94029 RepID=A0A8T0FAA3_ARGBR|nr:Gag-Pol polyprotein like [Argiope bruennichi]